MVVRKAWVAMTVVPEAEWAVTTVIPVAEWTAGMEAAAAGSKLGTIFPEKFMFEERTLGILRLTHSFKYYILLCGMNSKLNIRKAICFSFVLFVSISFPLSGAMADSCKGGAGCLDCTEPAHSHVPGTHTDMAPHGCQAAAQNSTCGFETSQSPDEFHGIVSSARSYHQAYSGIFAAGSDEYGQFRVPGEFISQFPLSDSGGQAPIYLLNQSLLC
jgi:hypothetical protein